MTTRVKMCGITTPEDARLAVAAGAHAIGLVMYAPSPRAVTVAQAQQVCAAVPVFVTRVGLFVNASFEEVSEVCRQVDFDLLQFHGDETNAFCASFNRPFIKALRIAPDDDVAAKVAQYPDSHGILLDAFTDGLYGGTGRSIDWQSLPALDTPVVLAGGLSPANVGEAIARVRPHGVDVSGGIERAKGIKDADKIRDFMLAVNTADDALKTR